MSTKGSKPDGSPCTYPMQYFFTQGHDKLFQTVAKPKTVNPKWDETFDSFVDNPFRELTFQVKENIGKSHLCIFNALRFANFW